MSLYSFLTSDMEYDDDDLTDAASSIYDVPAHICSGCGNPIRALEMRSMAINGAAELCAACTAALVLKAAISDQDEELPFADENEVE